MQDRLREGLLREVPEILASLVERAKTGDAIACKLILDRVLPPLRPVDQPAPVPLPADPDGAGRVILEALARGTLTPDQAAALAGTLFTLARVRETTLEARIQRLEDAARG